jgi:putative Mn2+ efflux pump MntP
VFEVLLLAIALSMDAFAVSITLGSRHKLKPASLAIMSGVYFGLFQAIMPLIGFLVGKGILGWIEEYTPLISFILLALIGTKMIFESFSKDMNKNIPHITHKVLLMLAVATSIDAIAVGYTLTLLDINPFVACCIIGVTTFFFSYIGVFIGLKSGTWLENKAELWGGVVLILIGVKILLL